MRNSIIALAVSFPLLAHAALENVFGIPTKTYCLKDVCIGDALSEHEAKAVSKLQKHDFPNCNGTSFSFRTKKAADGSTYMIGLHAAPALAGSDYSTYYRVSSVSYDFGKNLPQSGQDELADTLGKRMNLTHHRSFARATDRGATLKKNVDIKLEVSMVNAHLMAFAFMGNDRRAEINAQPGCTGKAPNI